MKFKAQINVVPNEEENSTVGKKLIEQLEAVHIKNIDNISVGKFYTLEIKANSYNAASAFVYEACKSVLAKEENELFEFTIDKI